MRRNCLDVYKRQLKRVGHETHFVDGLRYTDETTMDIVQSVLCGKVNKNLVAQLNRLGGRAVGLCGMDGELFQAECLNEKYGLVGRIMEVNPDPVINALSTGYIPVVSTVAQGMDADTAYNINADTAAAKLAEALHAEKLILLTDVRGLLRDPQDEETLIHVVHTYEVPGLVASGVISGGMIPKMECCVDAIAGGVERVHILDGRIPHLSLIHIFQLNVFLPVSAYNFLLSTQLLADAMDSFRRHCVDGIIPNAERMRENLNHSLMLVTCLTPRIGYEAAAMCAKKALADGTTLKDAVLALGLLTAQEFDEIVRPETMV